VARYPLHRFVVGKDLGQHNFADAAHSGQSGEGDRLAIVFGKQRGIGSSDANFKQIVAFVKDSFARYRFKLETIASCRVRALEQVASNGTDTSRKQRSIEDHELSYPHPCMER
jgi:hypothetical protein